MYAKGMTTRNIQAHVKDLYGYEISPETASSITTKVLDKTREWQSRALEPIYPLIYTTNPIESLNRQVKKTIKNKAIFPNEPALVKQVYLAIEEASRKWTLRHREWAVIYSQLMIYFGERLEERG
jgi:putative transposase